VDETMAQADARKSRWFDRATSALILIDHQIGTLQLVKNIASDAALRNAVLLAKAATTLGMPIVMTASMEDQVQGPLAPALRQVAPEAYDARVKRLGIVNAWADPNFKAAVEATGRRRLVMAGVTTDICLVFPSISAVNDGYEVQAVLDASGSSFELQEDTARRRMEDAGVVLTTTNTIVAELVQNWATPEGGILVPYLLASSPIIPPVT
jgi:nicotinamidase-related amidase